MMEFDGLGLMPSALVIEAKFFQSLTIKALVESGIAALALAIEAYISRRSSLASDLYAREAVGSLYRLLTSLRPMANANKLSLNQTELLTYLNSCLLAGLAIANSSPALLVGMSNALVSQFQLNFAWSAGVLLPGILEFSLSSSAPRMSSLAISAGIEPDGGSTNKNAVRFVQAISALVDDLALPNLAAHRLDRTEVLSLSSRLTRVVQQSGVLANHPRLASSTELTQLYRTIP